MKKLTKKDVTHGVLPILFLLGMIVWIILERHQ